MLDILLRPVAVIESTVNQGNYDQMNLDLRPISQLLIRKAIYATITRYALALRI